MTYVVYGYDDSGFYKGEKVSSWRAMATLKTKEEVEHFKKEAKGISDKGLRVEEYKEGETPPPAVIVVSTRGGYSEKDKRIKEEKKLAEQAADKIEKGTPISTAERKAFKRVYGSDAPANKPKEKVSLSEFGEMRGKAIQQRAYETKQKQLEKEGKVVEVPVSSKFYELTEDRLKPSGKEKILSEVQLRKELQSTDRVAKFTTKERPGEAQSVYFQKQEVKKEYKYEPQDSKDIKPKTVSGIIQDIRSGKTTVSGMITADYSFQTKTFPEKIETTAARLEYQAQRENNKLKALGAITLSAVNVPIETVRHPMRTIKQTLMLPFDIAKDPQGFGYSIKQTATQTPYQFTGKVVGIIGTAKLVNVGVKKFTTPKPTVNIKKTIKKSGDSIPSKYLDEVSSGGGGYTPSRVVEEGGGGASVDSKFGKSPFSKLSESVAKPSTDSRFSKMSQKLSGRQSYIVVEEEIVVSSKPVITLPSMAKLKTFARARQAAKLSPIALISNIKGTVTLLKPGVSTKSASIVTPTSIVKPISSTKPILKSTPLSRSIPITSSIPVSRTGSRVASQSVLGSRQLSKTVLEQVPKPKPRRFVRKDYLDYTFKSTSKGKKKKTKRKYVGTPSLSVTLGGSGIKLTPQQIKGKAYINPYQQRAI